MDDEKFNKWFNDNYPADTFSESDNLHDFRKSLYGAYRAGYRAARVCEVRMMHAIESENNQE